MKTSESIIKICEALCKAQSVMEVASFDSTNPHFKNKYASLKSIVATAKEPLAKNGLSFSQGMTEGMMLVTRIQHVTGEWIESVTPIILGNRNDMQALGSALTYAKRYALSSMLGIVADEDDDGNGASEKEKEKQNPFKQTSGPVAQNKPKQMEPFNFDGPSTIKGVQSGKQ